MGSSHWRPKDVEKIAALHGHLCPALAVGIRICEAISSALGGANKLEGLRVVIGAVTPGVDAVQSLLGATLGNGGLLVAPGIGSGRLVCVAKGCEALEIKLTDVGFQAMRTCPARKQESSPDLSKRGASDEQDVRIWATRPDGDLFSIRRLPEWRLPWEAMGVAVGPEDVLVMRPVGIVRSPLRADVASPRARVSEAIIEVNPDLADALEGLESYDHAQVLFRFNRAPAWSPLRQHPQGDASRPVRGVWALRSPHRPNGIGLTTVRLCKVEGTKVHVAGLDAWDGTPVLDIKPYVPALDEPVSCG